MYHRPTNLMRLMHQRPTTVCVAVLLAWLPLILIFAGE